MQTETDVYARVKKMHVTIAQKIILHLMRFNMVHEDCVNVPFDLTQDGIAGVVGIKRAHVSVELKKLLKNGKLICWKSHMLGSSSKRLAYLLSPSGIADASELTNVLRSMNIDPEMLLDMKRCNPADLWNNQSEEDRDTIGIACIFRIPIPRDVLPPTALGTIPTDKDGNIAFQRSVANNFISFASPARQRRWHSYAADYWLYEDNHGERLYHLTMAGRTEEAIRCICMHLDEFLNAPDASLLKIIRRLAPEAGQRSEVYYLGASVALDLEEYPFALQMAASLSRTSFSGWMGLKAEAYRSMGLPAEAESLALEAYSKEGSPLSAIVLSEIYADAKDGTKAMEYVRKAGEAVRHTGDARHIDRIFLLHARAAKLLNDPDTVKKMVENAIATCAEGRKDLIEKRILEAGLKAE